MTTRKKNPSGDALLAVILKKNMLLLNWGKIAMMFCPKCDAFGIPDYNIKRSVCSKCGNLFDLVIREVRNESNREEKQVYVVKKIEKVTVFGQI